MKKFAIGILIAVMLIGASAFATQTRTTVMGNNDIVMVDDANIWRFPGRINNYPDLALGEFSPGGGSPFDNEFYNFGITWQFNEDNPWVLGTFISTWPYFGPVPHEPYPGSGVPGYLADLEDLFDYYYYPDKSASDAAGVSPMGTPRRIQLMYGRELGGNDFGFSLDITRASFQHDIDSTVEKEAYHEFTVGAGLTEGTSGQWDIGASFTFGGWTDEMNGLKITEPNGYYDVYLQGRYFWVQNPKVTFVPHAAVTMGKRGADWHYYTGFPVSDTLDYTETIESKRTGFDVGMGMNYTTGPNMLAVADFGFMFNNVKYEFSTDEDGEFGGTEKFNAVWLPYLRIGFEGEVLSWLDIRAGGSTTLWSNQFKDEQSSDEPDTPVETYKFDFPLNQIWLGTGMHFGKLHIDTYTNPEIVTDGFNFISGSSDASNLNWQVSMLYELF